MEDRNILKQQGFKDSDFGEEFGIPQSDWGTSSVNRKMFDRVHEMNVEGYVAEGMELKKAKHMADKRRSMAMQAAKAAGLEL